MDKSAVKDKKKVSDKEKIISLIKKIDNLGDIKEVLLSTKEYYKLLERTDKKEKYESKKKSEYEVEYIEDGVTHTKKFRLLKDIASWFGVLKWKVSYCIYQKVPVGDDKNGIRSITKKTIE